ncbi:MAG: Uncharacterized protein AUK63_1358 [bacterium P3]|nr:MAG: Uncharacterized protein AUK63_1358 [bacterium P3]KWW40149.1 MAG: Uncharacterized protein F083_1871 [bacterium F083]
MKVKKIMMLFFASAVVLLTGCEKENENDSKFNYPMEMLYGKWKLTQLKTSVNGSYIDCWLLGIQSTYATFHEDGKYYGSGYFGSGYGTYMAEGNTITTYVSGSVYYIYTVISLTNNGRAELKMSTADGSSSVWIICEKQ